jgi:hypothetical protein
MQVFCFTLMVNRSGYQGSKVLNSSNAVVANVYQQPLTQKNTSP